MYLNLQYISPNAIEKLCKHFITPVFRGITWLENWTIHLGQVEKNSKEQIPVEK